MIAISKFKELITACLHRSKNAAFWDLAVEKIRRKGGSSRDVSMPPGVIFFENLYLWKRAVMEPISGRHDDNPIDWFFNTFVNEKAARALSISCGTGFWERRLSQMDFAESIDAFDYSQACLDWAREKASEKGLDNINYWQADINEIKLQRNHYDFVISVAALHHVDNLEHVLQEINGSLKPGGLFFYDEYIGPNRMQWTDEVLAEVNRVLATMPSRYRRQVSGGMKKKETRVPIEKMIEIDPTEAVRSEDILPLTGKYFEVLEKREYGGAILMPLFMNIIGNFDASREEDRRILDYCLKLEKELLEDGVLPANGVAVVCRKKD
jgi:2-polyprenyl-3-methyl-5-hydroxy-6-metoxy-1,4-benzoquinol methylase